MGTDGEEQDAEAIKQLEVALALAAKKKANAADNMAVAMEEDGANLSGNRTCYKRRACAGLEEQGEDIRQLQAKASPHEIATALKQARANDEGVQKHGQMLHTILADMADR
eukprot:6699902-Pyramimonas_sp.AAC.1